MKHSLTLFFFFLGVLVFGQCSPTVVAQTVFYPNTTSTHSSQPGPHFLCGPNTVLWDTVSCVSVMCNPSTTLHLKQVCLALGGNIYLKSGAVLNLLGGAPTGVIYEPGAIINDPFSLAITSTCSSLTFPNANCSTGLHENSGLQPLLSIWPNPSNDFIIFDILDPNCLSAEVTIFDQLNKIVFYNPSWRTADKKLATDLFDSGTYFVSIRTTAGQQTLKLLVLH